MMEIAESVTVRKIVDCETMREITDCVTDIVGDCCLCN